MRIERNSCFGACAMDSLEGSLFTLARKYLYCSLEHRGGGMLVRNRESNRKRVSIMIR